MWKHNGHGLFGFWSIRLLFVIGVTFVGAGGYADDTLLDYVQLKQQQSRALLGNYARNQTALLQSENLRGGKRNTQTRRMAVKEFREGQRLRLEVEHDSVGTREYGPKNATLGPYRQLTHPVVTVNENEAAYWEEKDGKIYAALTVWRHSSPEELQSTPASHVQTYQGIDLLDFGFGLKNSFGELPGDIESSRQQLAGLGTFRASKVVRDGAELVEITHEIDGRIWLTATVDPAKGYATTSIVTSAYPEGVEDIQRFNCSIAVEEVANGVWAPVGMEASEQLSRAETGSKSNSTVSVTVEYQTTDQHFAPEFFQWTTMNYPGDDAFLYDMAGVGHVMKISDAELRPAPFTDEATFAPEAVAAKMLRDLPEEGEQAPAPMQEDEPAVAPDEPDTLLPDTSPISPLPVILAVVGVAVLVGGLGVLAWRRS